MENKKKMIIIAMIVIAIGAIGAAGWFYWQGEKRQDLNLAALDAKTAHADTLINSQVDSIKTELTKKVPQNEFDQSISDIRFEMAKMDSGYALLRTLEDEANIENLAAVDTTDNWISAGIYEAQGGNPFGYDLSEWYKHGLRHPEVITLIWQKCRAATLTAAGVLSEEDKPKVARRLNDLLAVLNGRFDAKLIGLVRESNPRLIKARQSNSLGLLNYSVFIPENDTIKARTGATDNQVYQARLYVDLKDQFPNAIPVLAGILNECLAAVGGKAVTTPAQSGSKDTPAKAGAKKFKVTF